MSLVWQRWLKGLLRKQSRGNQRSARRLRSNRTWLQLERLEDRLVLALDATLGVSVPALLNTALASTPPPPNATPAVLNQMVIGNQEVPPCYSPNDPETSNADQPRQVSGAFLTDSSQITQANGSAFSFTDVEQAQSPTCSFAAALAAVAETNFDLKSSITTVSKLGDNNYLYAVRLYQPDLQGVYKPVWVDVPFDGNIYPTDLDSTDPAQYWPTLYQRAYEIIAPPSDATSFDVGHAFETITGQSYRSFSVRGASTLVASAMGAYLVNGQPMVAASRSNGTVTVDSSGVINDTGPIILDSSGVIHDHCYTVLGIDFSSSGPFVTLRNPWSQDTAWTHFDTNNDGQFSSDEDASMRAGLDGVDDGIIRIPWATFTSDFDTCVVSNITGPSINQPQSTVKPTFVNPNISPKTVFPGQTLTLDLSAFSPDGKAISYYLPVDPRYPNPGTVDLHTGLYTWAPTDAEVGVYNVTVIAQESPVESASLTYQVIVPPSNPIIGSFTSDRPAISTADGQITLTVNNIADLLLKGTVQIYRDTDHNGVLDGSDALLASLPYNSNNPSGSSGAYVLPLSSLPNLTPGTNETFFAQAQNTLRTSAAVSLTVQVIVGASLPPLVAPTGVDTLASGSTDTRDPALTASDAKGDRAVFWSDAQSKQAFMLRLDPSGTAIGSPISLNLVQGHLEDVAMLPDGHFVIAWINLSQQLYAREFNADGTPYTGAASQTGYEVSSSPVGPARIAIAGPGLFAVVYSQLDSGVSHTYLQSFQNGFPVGTRLLDNSQPPQYVSDVAVALDDHGNAVIAWIEQDSHQVMAEVFNAEGNPVGSAAVVNTLPSKVVPGVGISVATDEQGRYVITWTETNGTTDNLVARRFLPDGIAVDAAEFIVNDSPSKSLGTPRVAFANNKIVITWAASGASNNDVFAQAYTWDNTLRKLGGNFQVPTTAAGDKGLPDVALDATGTNFIIAWQSLTSSSPYFSTYFKRFNGLDLTPLGFSLDTVAPQPASLLTIRANPTANVPLGYFAEPNSGNWTFSLVSGPGSTDNASFQIANGLLSMTQAGVTSGLKAHYSIRVRATPDVGVPVEQVFDLSGGLSGDINFGQLVPSTDSVRAAVMQPNGQLVVVGQSGVDDSATALARYNPDGSLDPSFGGTGEILTHALDGSNHATGVAVQPDGKIVVIGTGFDPVANANRTFLARYNPDGSLDTSFGKGGILEEGSDVNATVVTVQNDGKIVIAGSDSSDKVALWRYNPDGTFDSTFGSGGKASLALGSQPYIDVEGLTIQSNGNIVVAGSYAADNPSTSPVYPFVARFLPNGSPDLSFNGVGYSTIKTLSGYVNNAYAVASQADGRILLAGSFGLLRLTSSGNLDMTFNGTGVVTTSSGSTAVVPLNAVAVGSDGKILTAGSASNGSNNDFVFIRYTSTGAVDLLQTKDLGGNDSAEALGIAPNGQIDIVGDTTINDGTADDFRIWQINEPVVTGIASSQGLTTGGTPVNISGYNFTGVTAVAFGSTPIPFTIVSPTEITAASPSGTGAVDVTVTTANGTSITSPIDQFTYQVQTTLGTPTASPNSVHPGGNLSVSIGILASDNTTISQGTVTFSLVNPSTRATVASDAGVAVSRGMAVDPNFTIRAGMAPGTYSLVASYSDIGGPFATTSTTAINAVSVTPVPLPPPPPPPALPPSAPPALNVPPLLALFNSLLGGVETINANGTETITDSFLGFPLLAATFDTSGKLESVDLFGIDVTFLFG